MPITGYQALGWLRGAVGVSLLAAPGMPMRLVRRTEPTAAEVLLMRTIGIRDLALGLGTVAAARSGDEGEIRRWLAAGLASDSLDAAASVASMRDIGKRDSFGAAILALAFACAGLYARRGIPRPSKDR